MEYINGICHTNLDDYDCSKITVFVAIPNIGDSVRVLYKGHSSTLRVVQITHTIRKSYIGDKIEPVILIELHN
ncbi:MAG: hypothetical protein M0R17_08050 [Candidatus Omnitrophica bacterium]|jgi:hypothetical protein|nr:hypothetical protein [Candidatus Omnitrophota bacterium]